MADLDLRIDLDRPDATYELGDTVSGTLHLTVHEDTELRGLLVGPEFAVEGAYLPAVGGQPQPEDVMVGGGHLRAGESRELAFEVKLPLEPPPYDGENFRLFWRIQARADLPMKRDARAEPVALDVRVGQPTREGPYTGHHQSGTAPDLDLMERTDDVGASLRRGCGGTFLFLLSLPLAFLGVGALAVFLPEVGGDPVNWIGVGVGMAMVLPSVFLFRRIRRKSVSGAVGRIEIEADPQVARPGETMACRVVLTPVRDLDLESVTLTLVAQEFYTKHVSRSPGSDSVGSDSTMTAETLHTDRRQLAANKRVAEGTEVSWDAAFQLADAVPYSIRTSTAGLRWLLRAEIEVDGVKTAAKEKPLIIRP